jgi:hypothetical protein
MAPVLGLGHKAGGCCRVLPIVAWRVVCHKPFVFLSPAKFCHRFLSCGFHRSLPWVLHLSLAIAGPIATGRPPGGLHSTSQNICPTFAPSGLTSRQRGPGGY